MDFKPYGLLALGTPDELYPKTGIKEYLKLFKNYKIQLKLELVQTRRVFLYGTQFISLDMTLKLTGLRQKMSVSNAVC